MTTKRATKMLVRLKNGQPIMPHELDQMTDPEKRYIGKRLNAFWKDKLEKAKRERDRAKQQLEEARENYRKAEQLVEFAEQSLEMGRKAREKLDLK